MEQTLTDAVFSRIALVYFCAEIKVLGLTWKFTKKVFGINKKYWRKNLPERAHDYATSLRALPRARRLACGVREAPPTLFPLLYIPIRRYRIREKISSCCTIQSLCQLLFFLGRADLESDLGSGEGKSTPSSSPTILHPQFHDILHRS